MEPFDLILSATEAQLVPLPKDVVAIRNEDADGGDYDGWIRLGALHEGLLRWDGHGAELRWGVLVGRGEGPCEGDQRIRTGIPSWMLAESDVSV